MATYSQKDRAFRLETPLGPDVLLLEGFAGKEEVSAPFHYTLDLLSEDDAIDPDSILRQEVAIHIRLPDGSDRLIKGFVSRFTQLGKAQGLTSYAAEVVPWIWFLTLTQDCRIFQNLSVMEIVDEIFGKYPDAKVDKRLLNSYSPREFCVQYRESDLNFVSRLLEEEGVFYFFDHSDAGHTLVLADDNSFIDPCPVQAEAKMSMTTAGHSEEDVIVSLQRQHSAHTTKVTITDYNYLKPSLDLQSTASVGKHEEVYDFPGRYQELSDGERYAKLKAEERGASREIVRGIGTVRDLRTGFKFDLTDYYRSDANQSYFVLSTVQEGRGGGYRSGANETRYQNEFYCIPVSVPYRPPVRAAKPVVQGSQTAVVVGPSGEIHTEEHGRVKVKFHWDRLGQSDGSDSCWVRVSAPWAGKQWGAVSLPRIGQEVVVDFLEGDPDRPLITGRVYNAEQMPPYSLPDNKTQSGVKSRSSEGGGAANFNEIRMEDKKGSEVLYIHAEKDQTIVVENDRSDSVGHDETTDIGNDQSLTVGNNQTIAVGSNRTETVGASHDESIADNMSVAVGDNRSMSVAKNLTEDVGQSMTVTVGKNQATSVGKELTLEVGKDAEVTVGGKQEVSIAKESIHQAKKIQITAKDEITLKTGSASILMKKNGDITIKGKKITVKGSGDVVVKGSKVALN